ncbi:MULTISPECIES: SDR family oxidoreductase [Burkholderia]|uniref:NAD(P)-dependent dehydrogenase (Short-subunit alcohol dehydrogenase family) n=1 Tax=Burkholderia pyrrocinia TaxID=60550 RepID=A0A318J2U9_BURPY|nr:MULTISPECIES: SDR family oxidoreductase [Burkholderia]PXX40637.1 NAD(P)-dependent dehydrogenase (short-subunit alcohol dehydrogenase family) [Burkholderia pyrrocinia]SFW29124.1 NAD(P)-dependent dehydrogenase, short-chain alcohol dehydrogenase family [Burkholderia sp. NFACC33-1]SFX37682.1 NAD(P)-dependent dehydrogenase, short-chain alcohol dehydrogenase family [Burkholderia sp. NFPP32]
MTRTTLVTGAAGGIGQALCRTFLAAGDRVLALDRDRAALDRFIDTLADARAAPVVDDLTDAERLRSVLEPHPQVDVLVANAGTAASTTLRDTTPASWRTDLDSNLTATYVSVEAVLPGMRARGRGAIAIVGSVNGVHALGHPVYSAAKAGLISYTKSLAIEYGRDGVRANIVLPGTVKTPAWEARVQRNPHVFEQLRKWYPLDDFATPDDVAQAALFLCSPAARIITGVALPVDGGLLAGNRVMAQELTLETFY